MNDRSPIRSALRRILVVDPQPAPAKVLASLFGRLGHRVYVAHDDVSAVGLARAVQPDLIMLELPGLAAFPAARQIRRQQRDKRPLMVATTDWDVEPGHPRRDDVDMHLVRPVEFEVLKQLLAWVAGLPDPFGCRPVEESSVLFHDRRGLWSIDGDHASRDMRR